MDLSRRAMLGSLGLASAALPLAAESRGAARAAGQEQLRFPRHLSQCGLCPSLQPHRAPGRQRFSDVARRQGCDARLAQGQSAQRRGGEIRRTWSMPMPTTSRWCPATMEGENHVVAALGLNENAGVVTDIYHYDASLAMYGELAKQGVPVTCLTLEGQSHPAGGCGARHHQPHQAGRRLPYRQRHRPPI